MASYDPIKDDQQAANPGYTPSQISAAWKLMTRGDKEGLRKRDIERIIRTFRPNTTAAEFEHIVGPLKGRITFTELKGILMSDVLPKLSKEDMAVVMNLVDVDKDGICSLDDFRTFVSKNLDAKNKVQAT